MLNLIFFAAVALFAEFVADARAKKAPKVN